MIKMKIEVFGTAACGVCRQLEAYLKQENMDYVYKTVMKDISLDEVEEIIGRPAKYVPVILVDGSETTYSKLKQTVTTSKELGDLEL